MIPGSVYGFLLLDLSLRTHTFIWVKHGLVGGQLTAVSPLRHEEILRKDQPQNLPLKLSQT